MAAAQHVLADRHEVCDTVLSIADELEDKKSPWLSRRSDVSGKAGHTSWRLLAINAYSRASELQQRGGFPRKAHCSFRMVEKHPSGQAPLCE